MLRKLDTGAEPGFPGEPSGRGNLDYMPRVAAFDGRKNGQELAPRVRSHPIHDIPA